MNQQTDEVEIFMLKEGWSCVISIMVLILALELCVCEEIDSNDDNSGFSKNLSGINSSGSKRMLMKDAIDFHNIAYDDISSKVDS